MEIKKYFLPVFFLILLFSCEINEEPTIDADNLLLGNWTNATYNAEKETTTFFRVAKVPTEKYAISFKADNSFLERTSGFCGTPPLSFFNNSGNFSLQENIIIVNVNNYPNVYAWRIIQITDTELVVKRELTEQEIDHRKLMVLFDEILSLAYGEACDNKNDWTFTAYGSKACGGPQGFIPYSTKIDVDAFLKKVEEYTEAENIFNKEWEIISTCDLPAQPKSVECNNGYSTLKYN